MSEYYTYTYDHRGRSLNTYHQLEIEDVAKGYDNNGEIPEISALTGLSSLVYDELGLNTKKKLHLQPNAVAWNQIINYDYNIRGWLTEINNPLFSMDLKYDITDGAPQFNGNISETSYRYDNYNGIYQYTYDGLNRLTDAVYTGTGDFTTHYEYDLNGNIETLERDGIDQLTYDYGGTNQLKSVNDIEGDNYQNNGFTDDGSFDETEYIYDNNGNMLYDVNKKILGIEYNSLNLPKNINISRKNAFNNIYYQYNAAGTKLSKQTKTNGSINTTTTYIDNFVFEDGTLKYILTTEGRIVQESGEMVYQYFIKDHLGNNRIMFDQNNQVRQQSAYYPYGMLIAESQYNEATYDYNRYLYNGKELQDDFELDWYDYGARFYDPSIARWTSVDPLAEDYYPYSPYNYSINNPIRFIDPDGRGIFDKVIEAGKQWLYNTAQDVVMELGKATVETVKNAAENIEGSMYAEASVDVSAGYNKSAKVQGLGADVQIAGVEIASAKVELDKDGPSGDANVIGKGKEAKFQHNLAVGAEGADISVGHSNTIKSGEGVVETETTVTATGGVVGLGGGVKYENKQTPTTNTSHTVKAGLFSGFSVGLGWRFSGSASIGYKIKYQRKDE